MPRRGENIRKRKDGRWEARYANGVNAKGQKTYASVYADSYREVKKKRETAIKQKHVPSNDERKDLRFKDILYLWVENNKIRLKASTVYRYSYLIESHILPALGSLYICNIDSSTINSFLESKIHGGRLDGKGGLSASYIRSIVQIINSTLKFAAENNLCSPLSGKINKPPMKSQELSILSAEDRQTLEYALLHGMDETKLGIYLSLNTGLRIGEVCALSWEDIDFANKIMFIRHTVVRVRCKENGKLITKQIVGEPKTRSSLRKIPLNSDLIK